MILICGVKYRITVLTNLRLKTTMELTAEYCGGSCVDHQGHHVSGGNWCLAPDRPMPRDRKQVWDGTDIIVTHIEVAEPALRRGASQSKYCNKSTRAAMHGLFYSDWHTYRICEDSSEKEVARGNLSRLHWVLDYIYNQNTHEVEVLLAPREVDHFNQWIDGSELTLEYIDHVPAEAKANAPANVARHM